MGNLLMLLSFIRNQQQLTLCFGPNPGRLRPEGRRPALPDVRPNDFYKIGQFLASFHKIAHNSGALRRAFARLELNDIKKLEFECNMWRVQMIAQPVEVLSSARPADPAPRRSQTLAMGRAGPWHWRTPWRPQRDPNDAGIADVHGGNRGHHRQ